MAEYTEAFARFIMECNGAYKDICDRIDAGDVPAGSGAKLTIAIPADVVDEIRFDRLAAVAEANDG